MFAVLMVLQSGLVLAFQYAGEDLRAAASAIAADEAVLKRAGFQADGPGLLEFFKKRTPTQTDQARLKEWVRLLGDDSYAVRKKATAELLAGGRFALPFLRPALNGTDLEIVRRAQRCLEAIEKSDWSGQAQAAARLLAVRRPAGGTAAVLGFLPFAEDEMVEEELLAALAVVGVREDKATGLLLSAVEDPRPVKRAAAAFVLGRSPLAEHRAVVRPLLADPDPLVRLRAALGLVAGKERDALLVLAALLDQAPLPLALKAEEFLLRVAGEGQPPTVALGPGTPQERHKCRQAWENWCRGPGAKVNLARLDLHRRLLGYTLLVTVDGYAGGGKVWEIGPDGKERWGFTNVQGAIDAEILPGNRVLVAEHGARRVTVRDFQGTILWERKVTGNPHDCQRLRNGHTFIATWPSEVLEVDGKGQAVNTHMSRHGSVTSGQKLRNGHVVYVTQNGNIVELDRAGKEVKVFKANHAPGFRLGIEELPAGRLLISYQGAGKVVEFDRAGQAVWECSVPSATAASRLANGHTLVCSNNNRVVEVDRNGRVVWELNLQGRPFRIRRR